MDDVLLEPSRSFAVDFQNQRSRGTTGLELGHPTIEFLNELLVRGAVLPRDGAFGGLHDAFFTREVLADVAVKKGEHLGQLPLASALLKRLCEGIDLIEQRLVVIVDDGVSSFEARVPSDHRANRVCITKSAEIRAGLI